MFSVNSELSLPLKRMRWIIPLLIYLLIEIYAYQAFRVAFKSKYLLYAYILVSLCVIALIIYGFNQPATNGTFTGIRAYSIGVFLSLMSLKLVLVVGMFAEDIFRFIQAIFSKVSTSEEKFSLPSRRKFISQLALGIGAIPFFSLLYGMYKGKYNYKVLKYELTFEDLPEAFDGYTLTQISDVHSGSFDNAEKVKYGISLINEQQSDVVVFTGDLVNNTSEEMEDWKDAFSQIKAKDGVFSVLGNHDYGDYFSWESKTEKQRNFNRLKEIQQEMGWRLLLDENVSLQKGDDKIHLVGVENWGKGGFQQKGDLDQASNSITEKDFKILLSHDPSHWDEVTKTHPKNFQLTLSGHTHGMQFGIEIPGWFKFSPVQFRYPQWAGVYQENKRFLHVNRGFGFLAYPGRVGMWPEVTVIKLRKT